MTSLDALVRPETYPRAATYDPQWMVDNCMGPNPLRLLEDLSRDCAFRPGMKVLDLGCGHVRARHWPEKRTLRMTHPVIDHADVPGVSLDDFQAPDLRGDGDRKQLDVATGCRFDGR